jgi:hypothetical protein
MNGPEARHVCSLLPDRPVEVHAQSDWNQEKAERERDRLQGLLKVKDGIE